MTVANLAAEEMVERVERAIVNVRALRDAVTGEERVRLTNKLEGLETILAAQRERFQHVETDHQVTVLAALIGTGAEPKHREAVQLVQDYLMGYVQG